MGRKLYSDKQHIIDLVDGLYRLGLRNVVVCPGSRSAPLTLAFARHGNFQLCTVIDERSAAYVAVGQALSTRGRTAVALVCTSGTALLNMGPAVAEAFYLRLPLLVLSADRPAISIDQLDGQTIRQGKVFESHTVFSGTLPEHGSTKIDCKRSLTIMHHTWTVMLQQQGPAHLNVPLHEPLYELPPFPPAGAVDDRLSDGFAHSSGRMKPIELTLFDSEEIENHPLTADPDPVADSTPRTSILFEPLHTQVDQNDRIVPDERTVGFVGAQGNESALLSSATDAREGMDKRSDESALSSSATDAQEGMDKPSDESALSSSATDAREELNKQGNEMALMLIFRETLRHARRILLVPGQTAPDAMLDAEVRHWLRDSRVVVLSESVSNLLHGIKLSDSEGRNTGDTPGLIVRHEDLLARDTAETRRLRPDVIISWGLQIVGKCTRNWLRRQAEADDKMPTSAGRPRHFRLDPIGLGADPYHNPPVVFRITPFEALRTVSDTLQIHSYTSMTSGFRSQPGSDTSHMSGDNRRTGGFSSQKDTDTSRTDGDNRRTGGFSSQKDTDTSRTDGDTSRPIVDTSQTIGETPENELGIKRTVSIASESQSEVLQQLKKSQNQEVINHGHTQYTLIEGTAAHSSTETYQEQWRVLEQKTEDALIPFMKYLPFGDLAAIQEVGRHISSQDAVHLGNSMPIRYWQMLGASIRPWWLHANRGTSGIDGVNSTALGFAISNPERIVWLITGDLSFVYDLNALSCSERPDNFRIVVINNQGGDIFRLIDGPSRQSECEPLFATPRCIDLQALAGAWGCDTHRASTAHELTIVLQQLGTRPAGRGPVVVEVVTEPKANQIVYQSYQKAILNPI
ncbi:MAG: hypothetical protein FJ344_05620 [Sphingomonadales bacterium]|nr:hypothetical protein [Sphingomonadales bacterium]